MNEDTITAEREALLGKIEAFLIEHNTMRWNVERLRTMIADAAPFYTKLCDENERLRDLVRKYVEVKP